MIASTTARGFPYIEFEDRYGETCSIQESSLASEDAIWFGIQDASPKVMASQASMLGVDTDETTGWVEYPLPKEVMLSTRMHLTRGQVAELLPILQHFVDTGEVSLPEKCPCGMRQYGKCNRQVPGGKMCLEGVFT